MNETQFDAVKSLRDRAIAVAQDAGFHAQPLGDTGLTVRTGDPAEATQFKLDLWVPCNSEGKVRFPKLGYGRGKHARDYHIDRLVEKLKERFAQMRDRAASQELYLARKSQADKIEAELESYARAAAGGGEQAKFSWSVRMANYQPDGGSLVTLRYRSPGGVPLRCGVHQAELLVPATRMAINIAVGQLSVLIHHTQGFEGKAE